MPVTNNVSAAKLKLGGAIFCWKKVFKILASYSEKFRNIKSSKLLPKSCPHN